MTDMDHAQSGTDTPLVDIVHVGFPKTATTWLQRNLLSGNKDILCIGKPYNHSDFKVWLDALVSASELEFDAQVCRDQFKKLLASHIPETVPSLPRVISYELLSGNLYTGHDSVDLLRRIRTVLGPVRLVVTIREQSAMIESLYAYFLRGGGSISIREFLGEPNSPAVDMFGNPALLKRFQYDRYIGAARELFGENRVTVIPYELLRSRGSLAFAGAFLSPLGLVPHDDIGKLARQENVSLSYPGLILLRWFNQVLPTPFSDSPLPGILRQHYIPFLRLYGRIDNLCFRHLPLRNRFVDRPLRSPLLRMLKLLLGRRHADDDTSIAETIRRAYAESNGRTEAMTGLPLAVLGYATHKD